MEAMMKFSFLYRSTDRFYGVLAYAIFRWTLKIDWLLVPCLGLSPFPSYHWRHIIVCPSSAVESRVKPRDNGLEYRMKQQERAKVKWYAVDCESVDRPTLLGWSYFEWLTESDASRTLRKFQLSKSMKTNCLTSQIGCLMSWGIRLAISAAQEFLAFNFVYIDCAADGIKFGGLPVACSLSRVKLYRKLSSSVWMMMHWCRICSKSDDILSLVWVAKAGEDDTLHLSATLQSFQKRNFVELQAGKLASEVV